MALCQQENIIADKVSQNSEKQQLQSSTSYATKLVSALLGAVNIILGYHIRSS